MRNTVQLLPTPCPLWQQKVHHLDAEDDANQAISCKACGNVIASTHPLADNDRPIRRPRKP